MSTPPATTAIDAGRRARPACAAASMPRAMPEATTMPCFAKARGDVAREAAAVGRGVARADHRDDRRGEKLRAGRARSAPAARPRRRRGRRDKAARPSTGCARRGDRARSARARRAARAGSRAAVPAEAAAARRAPPRRAEAAQQRVEGDRPDRLGARSGAASRGVPAGRARARPGVPQLFLNEMRLSVPASRRRMFS